MLLVGHVLWVGHPCTIYMIMADVVCMEEEILADALSAESKLLSIRNARQVLLSLCSLERHSELRKELLTITAHNTCSYQAVCAISARCWGLPVPQIGLG